VRERTLRAHTLQRCQRWQWHRAFPHAAHTRTRHSNKGCRRACGMGRLPRWRGVGPGTHIAGTLQSERGSGDALAPRRMLRTEWQGSAGLCPKHSNGWGSCRLHALEAMFLATTPLIRCNVAQCKTRRDIRADSRALGEPRTIADRDASEVPARPYHTTSPAPPSA
jgi:hypothetical protein